MRRRHFLFTVAVGVVMACRRGPTPEERAEVLAAGRAFRAEAALLGGAWLGQPGAPGLDELLAALPPSAEAIRAAHRGDLAAGRLVSVDGWMLTPTEVRLYAVVHLASAAAPDGGP